MDFGGLHKRAIGILAHNTQDFLKITNSLIARQAKDLVREIGVEVTSAKFAENLTVRETTKLMERRLKEENFYTVPWRNGKGSMRLDSYAQLVARTTTAEATNTGTLNQMKEMGYVLVQMTAHNTTCKVCAPRQGRVYRTVELSELPGNDPRRQFPHIREALPRWPEYKTVHPNCAHRITVFIWNQKTKDEQAAALKAANKPFNVDPRGETERKRYEEIQRKNRERLRDRKQWEKYRAVLGNENVPNLSGFRSMKRSENENWRFLRLDYNRQSELVNHPEKALPNAKNATAADAKFTNYLFKHEKHDVWAKDVAFESRLGYNASNWERLREEILEAAPKYPVSFRGEDKYVKSYEKAIVLKGVTKRYTNVIVGWKVNKQETWLTTAMIKKVKWE